MEFNLPLAFVNRIKPMLGSEWEEFYSCYSKDRYQALRLNTLKISDSPESLQLLNRSGMGETQSFFPVPWAMAGYYYEDSARPGRHPFHEMGLYYIQEPSAMSAAAVLAPKPGMRVLDLCAAPGGKTTQLASMMQQKGLLVANEINSQRARILSQNVERMGIRNCLVTNEDSGSLVMHFPGFFHKILVDAPCSGEGMFRKNPIALEEWSPENVALCAERQKEILDNAAKMLQPGGDLVYSTCTFAPEENEGSIASFLKRHPEFSLIEISQPQFSHGNPAWIPAEEEYSREEKDAISMTARLWPHHLHGEGHFAAHLKKAGTLSFIPEEDSDAKTGVDIPQSSRAAGKSESVYGWDQPSSKAKGTFSGKSAARKKGKGSSPSSDQPDQEEQKLLTAFIKDTFGKNIPSFLEYEHTDRLRKFGTHLYLLPEEVPSLRGLHVLRAGLDLGEFLKGRFEPSHALALTLSPEDCMCACNLSISDRRVHAFYRGESFQPEPDDFPETKAGEKGWCLFCVDGYSAGWGKLTGNIFKNHYPKGLRYDFDNNK